MHKNIIINCFIIIFYTEFTETIFNNSSNKRNCMLKVSKKNYLQILFFERNLENNNKTKLRLIFYV